MSASSSSEQLLPAAPSNDSVTAPVPLSPRRSLLYHALGLTALTAMLIGLLIGAALISATPSPSNPSAPLTPVAESTLALPIIQVTGGLISGSVQPRGQALFASIPFAAPPVGPHRWLPPQPVVPWSGVRDGTQLPSYCAQVGAVGMIGSEDCLYLNVHTPRVFANGTVSNTTLAPVLV